MIARVAPLAAILALACPSHREDVSIAAIQGRSHVSPLVGRSVRTGGIVTAVGREWAHVQDPSGDGDPATSEAVLVAVGRTRLRRGDEVRITGTVAEFLPGGRQTNLSVTVVQPGRVDVIRRGRRLPAPVVIGTGGRSPPSGHVISPDELPVNLAVPAEARRNRFDPDQDAIDFYESLEGMRVTVRGPVAVSATETFTPEQSQIVVLPDGGYGVEPVRRTRVGGVLLQPADAPGRHNPQRIHVQLDGAVYPAAVPAVRVGDRLGDVHGVVRYDFGHFEVAATDEFRVIRRPTRRETDLPPRSDSVLRVATYNVLNLSATDADGAQRALLARQIVRHLGSPEILALQEIQDSGGEADDGATSARGTLVALGDAIRAAGGPRYDFFDVAPADGRPGGAPGGNIRNAFLYRPDRVRLMSFRSLTPAVLGAAGAADTMAFAESRDPLEGVFEFRGRRLRVVNNHLTSRYGSTPVYGAVQPFVEAGAEARGAQARALRDYVRGVLAADPAAELVVLGDMNTFEFSPELAEVLPGQPPVLTPLLGGVPAGDRYTYNFEGNSQALDHVFVSEALRRRARAHIPHLNTDEPAHPGPAASDHDPVLVTID